MTESAAELTVPVVKSASALQQPLPADWFSEVRELRQKAEEYRYNNLFCVVSIGMSMVVSLLIGSGMSLTKYNLHI